MNFFHYTMGLLFPSNFIKLLLFIGNRNFFLYNFLGFFIISLYQSTKGEFMLTKNQQITLTCTNLGSNFQGICHIDGMVVFVPGMLPEEKGLCQIVKIQKSHAFGKLLSLENQSPQRQEPPCPYFPKCGGCSGQHLTYEATLTYKTQQVKDCFTRIGGFNDIEVKPAMGMEDPWHYRNKNALPLGGTVGEVEIGFFAPRSHRIVNIDQCVISMKESNIALKIFRQWMNEYQIPPYNEENHSGLVRHILTRVSQKGEIMVVLVATEKNINHTDFFVSLLQNQLPGLVGVIVSVQAKPTNVILGDHYHVLWGKDRLEDSLQGHSFALSPLSFFQVNPTQTEKLYQTALNFAALTGEEEVADLYCGVGTITLMLAKYSKKVVGIEQVAPAVEDAKNNALANEVDNVSFIEGDAQVLFPQLIKSGFNPSVVVVDPPRKGMDEKVVESLIALNPNKIVYISCDPATQARDAKRLAQGGYRITSCQPVDMFCWTGSIENVLLMEK